jgi:hypothetical protein
MMKNIEEIAKDVIRGKYGNGPARKEALEAAGYDYNAVQAEVNQEKLEEDKQAICIALAETLRLTRYNSDLECLIYEMLDDGTELVTIRWIGGTYERVNVTMDSGTAMIRDIMKRID